MNNDKRKREYLNRVFRASKSEISEIIDQAFQPNRCWMMLTIDEQVIQVPSYLLAQLSGFLRRGESVATTATKTNLKNDLEAYYDGCERVFIAAGNVFKDHLLSAYDNILKSEDPLYNKIEKLDALKREASRYSNFFGRFNEDLWHNTEGLIYGEPVDEVLSRAGDRISNPLKRLQPANYYSSRQWTINIEKLGDIRKAALPKAKQYISLQISEKSTYGTHKENADWVRENWYKYRKKLPSDRQTDLKIQKLYKSEFNGMTISSSQIQRFTGRQ